MIRKRSREKRKLKGEKEHFLRYNGNKEGKEAISDNTSRGYIFIYN